MSVRRIVSEEDGTVFSGREITFRPDGTADRVAVYLSDGSGEDLILGLGSEIGEVKIEKCAVGGQ